MDNNISFKSDIVFVNRSRFTMLTRRARSKYVDFDIKPIMTYANDFYSEAVRTCSGGGITDSKVKSGGYHIYDCFSTIDNLEQINNEIINGFNPAETRGLVIGGKNLEGRLHSVGITEGIIDFLKNKISALTYFCEHLQVGEESDFHYNLLRDTWSICTTCFDNKIGFSFVNKLEDLPLFFRHAHLAEGDRLFMGTEDVTSQFKEF